MRGAAKRIIQLARSICHAHTCCYSAVIFVASNWNFFLKYGKHRWGRDLCIVQRRVDENDSPLHWPCLLFVRQGSNLRPHAKNINLHASQLSGGSKQTGASYQFSVFSIQFSVLSFQFSVFQFLLHKHWCYYSAIRMQGLMEILLKWVMIFQKNRIWRRKIYFVFH